MITLPKNFFKAASADALRHSTPEGACWVNGDIWLLAGSPANPQPRTHTLLVSTYEDLHPLSPPVDVVDAILANLTRVVPPADQETFTMRAAILRAAMRSYFEP